MAETRNRGKLPRRGLVASGAALLAGFLARASERAALAADNQPLMIGVPNSSTQTTDLTRSSPPLDADAFRVVNANGVAIRGKGGAGVIGVVGDVENFTGVHGTATTGTGVSGTSTSGIGVAAQSGSGYAIFANNASNSLPAVQAETWQASTAILGQPILRLPGKPPIRLDGTGVAGLTGGGIDVLGTAEKGNGVGVQGQSATSYGVLGFSNGSLVSAVSGSGSGQAHGVVGTSANQFGMCGINQSGNYWAGAFFNAQANAPGANKPGLFVQGDFVVVNGTKNAAIRTERFGHRKMYAVEATENVFEDFGTVTLERGRARVSLDEVFSETVNSEHQYRVFPVPKSADSKGLAVVAQDANGFTIQELGGGTGSYAVDYRIVATVRGHEKTRMERFNPPTMPELTISPASPVEPQAAPVIRTSR